MSDAGCRIAMIGNPNTGKSTTFNALTGLRQKVGNYAGVTVEKHVGRYTTRDGAKTATLIDLPGTYSLSAQSPDEMIAVDVLLGKADGEPAPDAVVVVADATNLRRNLYLAAQVLDIGIPTVIALNMMDLATRRGIQIATDELATKLGCPVVPIVAAKNKGLEPLRAVLDDTVNGTPPLTTFEHSWPELRDAAEGLAAKWTSESTPITRFEVERAIVDVDGYAEVRVAGEDAKTKQEGEEPTGRMAELEAARRTLSPDVPIIASDAQRRYKWIGELLEIAVTKDESRIFQSDRLDKILTHPLVGSAIFVLIMGVIFQAVFAWAGPLMDLIDGGFGWLGEVTAGALGEGALSSLVVDGVIGGVGSVVIFLPQILFLFVFIILLEDSGYMSRAAFLMDRLMRWCGLSGQSFIPMLSSFACAIPGIMATRVIPDKRDRFATILSAPFMTCAARLPVYALLIGAFIPNETYFNGLLNLQGLVLLGLYFLGIFGGVLTAFLMKSTLLKGPTPTFLMELPPYRLPHLKLTGLRLWDRARAFLVRAGTIIFVVTVVVWALAYFPQLSEEQAARFEAERTAVEEQLDAGAIDAEAAEEALASIDVREGAVQVENSAFGVIGHAIQPIFAPLGWDWRISASVVASFPAREVVVAVLATTYAVGEDDAAEDEGEGRLAAAMKASTDAEGNLVWGLPLALGVLVFFVFCMQCGATVAIIKREMNSWGWAIFAWCYATALGYLLALATYQVASAVAA